MAKIIHGIMAGISAFLTGFVIGVKETPRAYFAPAVAIWDLLLSTTDSLDKPKNDTKHV